MSNFKESKVANFFKKIGRFFKKHIKLTIVLLVIALIVLYVRHQAKVAAAAIEAEMNKPVTATVEKMDLTKSVSVTGTLTANETTTVTSTLGGTGVTGVKVKKVNYQVGDYVEAGTTVVEFDGDDYSRKVAELNAKYNIDDLQSVQNIADLQHQIQDLQKQISEDQQWLDKNKDKYDNLVSAYEDYKKYGEDDNSTAGVRWNREKAAALALDEPISIDIYEKKQDSVKSNTYQIQLLESKIQIAQLQQNYDQTYTQVDAKKDIYESMDKTKVDAPISGYILTMNVEEGNNYNQGSTVFTIADTSGYIVEATVNEYDIANIQKDLPAVVKFEATGDEEFDGTVSFVAIASEASTSSQASAAPSSAGVSTSAGTATYKIKIKMTENDDRFRVGMTAKASVILDSSKDVLAVPYDCVQKKDDGSFFVTSVAKDGTKKDIPVTKGLESEYYVAISGDGIKEGMTVEAIVSDAPSTDVMDYVTLE